ncbi:MAG TPA: FliH/SctL family protein [Devosiaceae bacterium]
MSAATAPVRFTFDLDLSCMEEHGRTINAADVDTLVAEARRQGFEQGWNEARGDAEARAREAMIAAAGILTSEASRLTEAFDRARAAYRAEAAQLAVEVGRKLAGRLVERQPIAEIEALVEESLASLNRVPHVVIQCAPDLADAVRETAETAMKTSGYAGRLVVMGDPDIAPGDARIEWADGGLVRDTAQIDSEISRALSDYLASHGGNALQDLSDEGNEQ